jgi:hypothetical protein
LKYSTQRIAYLFFATSMLLLTLQIIYGFIMGFAHMGYDGLHESVIPFKRRPPTHTNLLVVWLLTGFMGAAYYILPEEAERELYSAEAGHHPVGGAGDHRRGGHHRVPCGLVGRAANSWRSRGRWTSWWWWTCCCSSS